MASSSSFAQIWSGVQVEYDDAGKKHNAAVRLTNVPPPPVVHSTSKSNAGPQRQKWDIVWRNVVSFLVLHIIAVYGLFIVLAGCLYLKTVIFLITLGFCSALGITAGAHRLWAHRSYNARLPLRLLLATFQTLAFQNNIYEWVRDHRVHHKFTDTNADPHNSTRGFFFSHMGWLMVRKHPDVMAKGRGIDMKDLETDRVVMFQKKYYLWLMPVISFLIPSLIPYYFWHELYWYSLAVVGVMRYVISLHFTWLVNSAAHIWGTKPYDKNITSTENITVAVLAFGEGWHNYHHTFPWDYKAAELGNYRYNFSTAFIDVCARLGLAYNLKTVNASLMEKRIRRTGNGTKTHSEIWGWGDNDMMDDDKRIAHVLN